MAEREISPLLRVYGSLGGERARPFAQPAPTPNVFGRRPATGREIYEAIHGVPQPRFPNKPPSSRRR
jgi:hypothetical protein